MTRFPVGGLIAGPSWSQQVRFDGIVSERKAGGGHNTAVHWINPRRNMESNNSTSRACRFSGPGALACGGGFCCVRERERIRAHNLWRGLCTGRQRSTSLYTLHTVLRVNKLCCGWALRGVCINFTALMSLLN